LLFGEYSTTFFANPSLLSIFYTLKQAYWD